MEAEEIKAPASHLQVHYPGLGRLRLQAETGQQASQALQRPFGLAAGPAHDGRIVGITHQDPVLLVPCPVEPVQVDVAEDGTYHPTLWGPGDRPPKLPVLHYS